MPRARRLDITIDVPPGAALALAVDLEGNERVLPIRDGAVELRLTRPPHVRDAAGQLLWLRGPEPVFVRFLDGVLVGDVFFQNFEQLPAEGVRVLKGTPRSNAELVEEVSRDRDLPAIGEALPPPGAPMVLYSRASKTLYIVGRTDADVTAAEEAMIVFRANARVR